MKKELISLCLLVVSLSSLSSNAETLPNEAALREEARAIVKTFGGTLKPKLQEGIRTGGFAHAIKVCSIEAPKIAANLSAETGWHITRVSLKPRNTSTASPDAFERAVLHKLDALQAQGASPSQLEYSALTENKFRYLKAQATEGICLNCHGTSIPSDVEKMLSQLYSDDMATGYSLGQVRGAFSLIKDL